MTTDISWERLRSDIYIRDKAICWICNTYVNLKDYDLGHLVDRCNNGQDEYENLAVMHRSCNLSKPYFNTLEEAIKWKLTNSIPAKSYLPEPVNGIVRRYSPIPLKISSNNDSYAKHLVRHPKYIKPIKLYKPKNQNNEILHPKMYENIEEKIARIKPDTLCWIQGRPLAKDGTQSPMWRLLPPPYTKDVMFTMRETPPNAIDNDGYCIYNSIQVLNGELKEEVNINIGVVHFCIKSNNGKLEVKGSCNYNLSNSGERSKTIGMGIGQIPFTEWYIAKKSGVNKKEFIEHYWDNKDIPSI